MEDIYSPGEIAAGLALRKVWIEKWPLHCRACGGHGGSTHTEMHGFRYGAGEQIFDVCEELPAEQCHRCGEHGLTEDGEGPCKSCGWNFDDGIPEIF